MSIGIGSSSSRGRSRSNSNGSTPTAYTYREQFPSKLYEMLESVESLGLSHIVCWLPHGESLKVIDPAQFMDLVVPKFFKATKYRSFQRQLNLWGFKRIVKGQDTACWRHEYFKRGCPELISKISRRKVKSRRATEAANTPPEAEAPMQAHSDDSLEGASDYYENDSVHYLDASGRYVARQMSDSSHFAPEPELFRDEFDASGRYVARQMSDSTYFAPEPEPFRDEFDEKISSMFSERSQSQSRNIGFANSDQMWLELEPLPIDSVGILDSPCNRNKSDLDELGQLLGRLIE